MTPQVRGERAQRHTIITARVLREVGEGTGVIPWFARGEQGDLYDSRNRHGESLVLDVLLLELILVLETVMR